MNQLKNTNDLAPALTLMIVAPLLTEVLPGATRFSSIFVFPIEVVVWGGGALMIRYALRRWNRGWLSMLFLAVSLALAEECIIQQTSLAPLVIRLKGETYARALGINYVYMLWALIYEPVFVVFLSIYLVELIFPGRRDRRWISQTGFFFVIPLFLLGSLLAWFSWTHIARTKVFKVPVYNPPLVTMLIVLALIAGLIIMALSKRPQHESSSAPAHRPNRDPDRKPAHQPRQKVTPLRPFAPWLLGITAALWTVPLYGLVLLGFGIAPGFPPLVAVGGGLLLLATPLFFIPRWTADPRWQPNHLFALIVGTILGSMLIGFVGFMGTSGPDLYFKIITNIIAVVLLIALGSRLAKSTRIPAHQDSPNPR